ncbi:MAG: glycosyltransferase, partial [Leptotrichiaceae bacterium]
YPKLYFFSKFYKYLYKINIKSNNYVIVQQEWIRKKFEETFGINNVIVALPVSEDSITEVNAMDSREISFVYPALSRFFKNFEVICKACSKLEADGITNFKVNLTIDGTENSYSRKLVEQYSHLKTINFLGIQKKSDIIALYEKSTCMIFSSKLETWGLPISEFKAYNKPMLVSDLEYAHETVGNYQKVSFFQPDSYVELSSSMSKIIKNETFEFDKNDYVIDNNLFCKNWTDLFDIILK